MACDQTFHEGELDRLDVRDLLALHFAEMRADSPPEACHVLPVDGLGDPAIRFFSLRDGDGALLGVGGAILAHLTATARAMAITRLSLETGTTPTFAAANRLYQRSGFVPCGPFGGYPDSPFTGFYTRFL